MDEYTNKPYLTENDEIIDMSGDFDFADYQVVRREFFAHMKEPAASFASFRANSNKKPCFKSRISKKFITTSY